jgi:DNA primase
MTQDVVDFQKIKSEIPLGLVLQRYGVSLRSASGELRGHCPLPTHTSRDSRDSFSVNVARNVWCCQSLSCSDARQGHLGGTVLDLVSNMERCSIREAAIHLKDWFGGLDFEPARAERKLYPTPQPNLPLRFQLPNIDHMHAYLETRGITAATARSLGIGYYAGPGTMHGRVVIPVRNVTNELVGYAGRSINGEEPKYLFPAEFHKSQELFHLNRARLAGSDCAIVVEGFFDAATVRQAGYRNVVALMGSSLSDTQAWLLQKHFRRAVLMLDGDAAGQRATTVIADRLGSKMEISAVILPADRQPDQLGSREIRDLVSGHTREPQGYER